MPNVTVVRTYLEMTAPGELQDRAPAPPGARIDEAVDCPWHFYRYLYVEVGRPYHWRDRLSWTEAEFRAWLAGPSRIWLLTVRGSPAGFFELRRWDDGSVEIAYFGVLPGYQGRGFGKYLLTVAVEEGWRAGASKVWLHTCTLDHPGALPNYLKRGFRTTREESYTTVLPDQPVISA